VLTADRAVPEAPAGPGAEGVAAVVDQRLPLEAVGQGERVGVLLLDGLQSLVDLVPGRGDADAHLLPDVPADDQGERGHPDLLQADGKYYMLPGLQEVWVPSFSLKAGQHVVLPV